MIEVVNAKAEAALPTPEAERLVALISEGADAIDEAEELTTGMTKESTKWLKLDDPKVDWGAEAVRDWWLDRVEKAYGEGEMGHLRQRWAKAFKEAKEERAAKAGAKSDFKDELEAATAKLAEAKAEPKPEPESEPDSEPEPGPEPEQEEAKEEDELKRGRILGEEEAYVEDEGNGANDIRRKLWRLSRALACIEVAAIDPEAVGAMIWRLSKGTALGRQTFVDWLEEPEGGKLWAGGFRGARWCGVEEIYRLAQRRGWRYPIAQNLNKLEEMVGRTEAALVRGEAEIYQAGDQLVRPVRQEVDATKGRKTNIAVLVRIDPAFLKTQLTAHVDFFKWDKKDDREGIGPSADVVNGILDRYGKWKFPVATGIVTAPTLRRDGSVLAREGWDPATGLIVMGPLPAMPKLSLKPSREDAERAARILDEELLGEFPFCDEASRAAALSGLITPNVRAALTCVPMHNTTAPSPGTGKSFIWDIAAGIAVGDNIPIAAAGKDIEEMEKRLNTKILQGLTLFSLDNVSIPIGGDALCQMIERPTYSLRILGLTKGKDRRNTWSIFGSGTNLRAKDDLTRRQLLVRMDAKTERPELRKFKENPFARVLADRGRYIWAALTIVLAYRAAGRPGKLPGFGDPFEEWSDNVRSALVWLGYADPLETMNEARERDPNRQARMAMIWAMFHAYASEPRTAAEMIDDAKSGVIKEKGKKLIDCKFGGAGDLKAAIVQYTSDRLDAKYLGSKLTTDRGRITDGLTLCSEYNTHTKVNTWWVEK
jgi:putative DNA primase/helicase